MTVLIYYQKNEIKVDLSLSSKICTVMATIYHTVMATIYYTVMATIYRTVMATINQLKWIVLVV